MSPGARRPPFHTPQYDKPNVPRFRVATVSQEVSSSCSTGTRIVAIEASARLPIIFRLQSTGIPQLAALGDITAEISAYRVSAVPLSLRVHHHHTAPICRICGDSRVLRRACSTREQTSLTRFTPSSAQGWCSQTKQEPLSACSMARLGQHGCVPRYCSSTLL